MKRSSGRKAKKETPEHKKAPKRKWPRIRLSDAATLEMQTLGAINEALDAIRERVVKRVKTVDEGLSRLLNVKTVIEEAVQTEAVGPVWPSEMPRQYCERCQKRRSKHGVCDCGKLLGPCSEYPNAINHKRFVTKEYLASLKHTDLWCTGTGHIIRIKDMHYDHVCNAVSLLIRMYEDRYRQKYGYRSNDYDYYGLVRSSEAVPDEIAVVKFMIDNEPRYIKMMCRLFEEELISNTNENWIKMHKAMQL